MAVAQRSEPRVRNQVITPRARRIDQVRSRKKSAVSSDVLKSAAALAKPIAIVAAIVMLIIAYRAMTGSRLFQLHSVTVRDASEDLRGNIEEVVRRAVGDTRLLSVDLAALKKKVETMPRVRTATVSRVLPDGIFVRVAERKPVVLALRQLGTIVWLDQEAVEMGEYQDLKALAVDSSSSDGHSIPPIVKGFAEGTRSPGALADDRERVALYQKIEQEFSEGPSHLWNNIDQIDLSSTKDVNLQLAKSPVTVHVGNSDFRRRFERAIQVLQAIKQGDIESLIRLKVQNIEWLIENRDNINFIDAARPDRIVVNFATPGAQKAARQEASPKQAPKRK